jgi:hypothetical protein
MEIDFSAIMTSLLSAGGLLALLEVGRAIYGAITGRQTAQREAVKDRETRHDSLRREADTERRKRILWEDAALDARNIARKRGATDEELGDLPNIVE